MFLFGPARGTAPSSFQAVRMAFPLDQGLQSDSLWSSGDLFFEDSLEDHGVSGQLAFDKIALEISVWQRCRPLQLALTAHLLLRRREGVGILCDTAPLQEAFFLSLQLLDMSHRRWSSLNASAPLEFGDIHSLAAAAFVTSKLLLGGIWTWLHSSSFHRRRGLDLRSQCALYPACSQLLQPVSTDFGPTTP